MLRALEPVKYWTRWRRNDVLWSIDRRLTTEQEVCRVHKLRPSAVAAWRNPKLRQPAHAVDHPLLRFHVPRQSQRVLEILNENRGVTIERDALMQRLYGNQIRGSKTIDVMIWRLRHALRSHARIITVWGIGHRLEVGE